MGGWVALLLALARTERVNAVIGIAAAPDFTEDLVWNQLSEDERARMRRDGFVAGTDGDSLRYTLKLVEEGRRHLLLHTPLPLICPVHLLQGQQDEAVPWQTADRIKAALPRADVKVTLVPDGDHRLSRPQDLGLLWQTLGTFF